MSTFTKAKFDFVRYSEIDMKGVTREVADDILNILLEEKEVVKVTDDMYTLMSNMESAKAIIQDKLKEKTQRAVKSLHWKDHLCVHCMCIYCIFYFYTSVQEMRVSFILLNNKLPQM